MMFGIIFKDLGSKLVGDQARNWHRNEQAPGFLPQDVLDHLTVERKRRPERPGAACSRRVATASVIV